MSWNSSITKDRLTAEVQTSSLKCVLNIYIGDAQGEINNSEVWLELEFI